MGHRVEYFDIWHAGYANAAVAVYIAGTSTLADLFTDEALTVPAGNPQTLVSMFRDGMGFGKFGTPLYTASPYDLTINSTDETGIIRPPLTTLEDEDASEATVIAAGGSVARPLEDVLAGLSVNVLDYGEFKPTSDITVSASTNNASLVAAIGAVAAAGGGFVDLPAGTYPFTELTVSPDVVLRGKGRDVTVLQSEEADAVLEAGGDGAGLQDLSLDGVSNQAGSVGLYAKANNEIELRRVLVKRFETGLHARGGRRWDMEDFSINACATGAKLHGDNDASGGADGDEFRYNRWEGGRVSECTVIGVDLQYVDKKCYHNTIDAVQFEDNTGTALRIKGARWTDIGRSCTFEGNTVDLDLLDGDDADFATENTVVGFRMGGGEINGNMSFSGKCQDVIFERVEFNAGTYTLATVFNQILTRDCTETADVALAGNDATKWVRSSRTIGDFPNSAGVTTDNVATEAWAYNLAPGEVIMVAAKVIGAARNGIDTAVYHIGQGAARAGSALAYDGQTVNFTLGSILTGQTSGATARIIADADGGATGTLTLRDIVGEFVDNETITDALGGTALANGVLVPASAALLGSLTSIQAAVETDAGWACIFAVSGDEMRVMVTGNTGDIVEWTVAVQVVSGGG